MMIDASALLAILRGDPEGSKLAAAIEAAKAPLTSPLAVYEAVAALMREKVVGAAEAEAKVRRLLAEGAIRVVPVGDAMATKAAQAFERFGKGRHPAALNFGDCFAYACAKAYRTPLLTKGPDFVETDVNDAARQ